MGALSPTMSVLLGDFVRGAGVEEDDEAEVEEDGGEEAAEAEAMTLEPETLIEADGLPVAYDEVREGGRQRESDEQGAGFTRSVRVKRDLLF